MHATDLIAYLNERGIYPYVEQGRLKTRSDNAVVDPEVVQAIRTHKDVLVEFLVQGAAMPGAARIVPLQDRDAPSPLSFAQQRLWFIDQLEQGSAQYNVNIHLTLRGQLDLPALQRTLDALVERHEVLRTRYAREGDDVVQVVEPARPVAIDLQDLGSLAEDVQSSRIEGTIRGEAVRLFDLGSGCLLRATLLRVAADVHVVLFATHHIASDGWSKGILLDEFCQLYGAFHEGKANPLPALPVQYRDYAAWQRSLLSGEYLQSRLAWWVAQLQDAPPVHGLPLSHPRPAQQRFSGGSHELALPGELSRKVRASCAARGMTPFILMHTAFAALLARFGSERDIVVGTPVSGRLDPDVEPLVGFFINTLALRTPVRYEQSFDELLEANRQAVLGAFQRQEVPFELVVDALNPARSLSYSPLFQILFSFHSGARRPAALPGLLIDAPATRENVNQFDIELNVSDDGENLATSWTYNRTLFDVDAIARMASAFRVLLEAALDQPQLPVGALPLLTTAQREAALTDCAGTAAPFPDTACIHQLFEAQARATPRNLAAVCEDASLDFAALNARANRLAHYLRERGVGPGHRVGICLKRSLDLPVALLAVLKAGAAYVPLDPESPEARLRFMIADASLAFLLTTSELWHALSFDGCEVCPLDFSETLFADQPDDDPVCAGLDAGQPAYVIYTSGSTGQPKGVLVPHRGVVNYLTCVRAAYRMDDLHGAVVATPFAFDATVTSLVTPWLSGRPAILLSDEVETSLGQLLERAGGPEPMLFKLTPAHLEALSGLAQGAPGQAAHVVVVGGEQLTSRTLAKFRARVMANAVVVNEYGPTEAVVGCSIHALAAADAIPPTDAVPIGHPIQNTRLYVLDERREPVPVGVTGELYIGGAGVASGYLNQDELTAAKFIADPFRAGERLYRSGDLVRWRGDGSLEFVGRVDDQVKLNGFRIELGEIEAQLEDAPGVSAGCAGVRACDEGTSLLVVYVVPHDAVPWAAQDEAEIERWRFRFVGALRAHLQTRLPDYMMPSAFVLLRALPVTANNKLDRAALPSPQDGDFQREAYMAPQTELERALTAIWQRVLRLDRIGIDDPFFQLGGHSLLATRMVSDIAESLQRQVQVRAVFEHPTIRTLAAHLETQHAQGADPIPRVPRDRPLPLSFAQQRLWFVDQLEGTSRKYHVTTALRITGRLDVGVMQRALDTILERHEVLRTGFRVSDGEPRQHIAAPAPLAIRTVDLSGLPAGQAAADLAALMEAEGAEAFDLAMGPMLRCSLVRVAGQEHVVVLTLHHIASDGWSTAVLVKEFVVLYEAFVCGRGNPLPALEVQYADYAHWQRSTLDGAALEAHLSYWRTQLADIPSVHGLPLDRPRPNHQNARADVVEQTLDGELHGRLRYLAQAHDASMFMLLQAAFALLVGRWSGETDVVIGSPIAGRTHKQLEPLVGFFINSLVLRTDLSANPTFSELLAQARQTALDAYAHQAVPFDLLVDAINPERSLNHAPLFQISFTFHNLERVELHLPGLVIAQEAGLGKAARYDLELHVAESPEGLHVRWLYADTLFHRATVERLAESFAILLAGAAAQPDRPVQALPLLPEQDRLRLSQWAGPEAREIPPVCAHELFQARVLQSPDALAVAYEDDRLSYAELNAEANRVASYLRMQGAGPGDRVALCVDRSVEMVIGLLGILKAGAAYLPIDPTYPEERVAAMLADAGAEHVLTQTAVLEVLPVLGERTYLPLDAGIRGPLLAGCEADDPSPQAAQPTPSDLAYLIYTSGSTGTPKGVMLEHRGLVNLALNQQALFDLKADSRVLAFASLSFDGAVWEWLMALASGASLHICRQDDRRSAEQLAAYLTGQRITHAAIPPALLALLPVERDYALEVLIVAGEACDERLAWTWAGRCRVCNSYGPSEGTVAATHADILPDRRITLGRALANVELQVLDPHGQPTPVGVPGELCLGGAGLARGYLNRPDLQAERFIAHPSRPDGRLYRTGDRVGWRADGQLQFFGRMDDQVKIRGHRVELGEIESQVLAFPAVREAVVVARTDGGPARLVAYVVTDAGTALSNDALLAKELRSHLRQRLPDYMLPAAFVTLDAVPLTRNGKVDKRRLPVPDYQAQQAYVAPRDAVETKLTEIWREVLRVEQVGIHDNFFEIGGDSILSIQVVSRANQAGIAVTTKQLFEAQTVAEFAKLAATAEPIDAPQEAVEGALSLLPIHHLFLTGETRDRHHYNQAVLLATPAGFRPSALRGVIEALYRRHDALRLRFAEDGSDWRAWHAPLDEAMLAASCVVEPLPDSPEGVTARCTHWQRSFDLAAGPLVRAVYFDPDSAGTQGRLLLVVHHIVVDGVSWRVLLADLEQAFAQHERGEPIVLQAKTSSFQAWGAAMAAYAHGQALQEEKAFWLAQCGAEVPALPTDRATPDLGLIDTTRTVAISLTERETRALQQQCPRAYRTQINDLLLAGVYLGMRAWTGADALRLRLEGHGREPLFDELDVTQTVGWFTSVYPLLLQSGTDEVGAVIKSVKEQCNAVPHRGIGYGVLRYLARDPQIVAASHTEPELEFNYLGQFDQVLNEATAFQAAPERVGEKIGRRRRRMHRLGLSGKVFGGELHFVLDYSEAQYDRGTMQRLAGAIEAGLRRVIDHCLQDGTGGFTPSDFPLANVDQGQLDLWHACYPAMSRLYPATPLQAGLRFESRIDPATYVVQTHPLLKGALDTAAFRAAWEQVVERHDIFRTAFVGGGDRLHQLVSARAVLPWHEEDWRDLDATEQTRRFEAYRRRDRLAGFDFGRAPLLRIALFRLADDRYRLLWTHHHILSDGWSSPLVYRDVVELYRARMEGREPRLKAVPPYENYIAWLTQQDRAAARAHWRTVLGDVDAPTPLSVDRPANSGGDGNRDCLLHLTEEETRALAAFAKVQHTTVNTIVQWCWAYLLHRYSGESEIVFGATLAGRAPAVEGVEEMVGLFINTIPVRVSFAAPRTLPEALRVLHRDVQQGSDYGYLSLIEIQQQSGVPLGTALFDSLLVFENLPIDAKLEAAEVRSDLELEQSVSQRATHYKLTLIANLAERLQIRIGYRAELFAQSTVERLAAHLAQVLRSVPAMAVQPVPSVSLLTEGERGALRAWNPSRAYARDAGICEIFQARAAEVPDATALVLRGERMGYRELDARSNRIAHCLIAHGVLPGSRVGLHIDRSFDMVAGLLGILKCGAAYVPLDPGYPPSRLAYMCGNGPIELVLTRSSLHGAVEAFGGKAIAIDLEGMGEYPASSVAPRATDGTAADQVACVLYTSGSTGVPKGVELTHRTLVNLMDSLFNRYPVLAAPLPTLQFSTINFDMSLYEIVNALFTGAPLVLLTEEDRLDLPALVQTLRREKVARMYLPTAMLSQFAEAVIAQGVELPDLRLVQVAGEQLAITPAVREWARRSGCEVLNLYGPTESHVVSECLLDGDPDTWPAVPPIGRPIDNVQLYIVDVAQDLAPVGVTGELHVAGDGLARGYLNRLELTAERFVERSFDGQPPVRMYRTGDLACWRPDGSIDYVGRMDNQLKVRGFRVEPSEIETVLADHPEVAGAVVVAVGKGADKRLVGYVASRQQRDGLVADLQSLLQRTLPPYMVPAALVSLPALPLTPNGKIDRAALPKPERALANDHVPPASDTETRLVAIWERLLKIERIGTTDRFFDLGGHSLLAMQLVSAIQMEFSCTVRIQDVFAYPAIKELAQLVDALGAHASSGHSASNDYNTELLEEKEW